MSLENPRPPHPEVEKIIQDVMERADELYEYLRAKYHPDVPRHQELHPAVAYSLRARALSMAILERDYIS